MVVPADNPMTEPKVALGKRLFFDKRLSGDRSRPISCHKPQHGLTEAARRRQAPAALRSLVPDALERGLQQGLYWEGAGRTIEQAVAGVWRQHGAGGLT
jgi:cytochrome c peroxidase